MALLLYMIACMLICKISIISYSNKTRPLYLTVYLQDPYSAIMEIISGQYKKLRALL